METHGPERDVKRFDEDIRDGLRGDDLYTLGELPFHFLPEQLKIAKRNMLLWYHPDKCKQRAFVERKHDASFKYPDSKWKRAQKKF